ncbi:MAG: hypothetical protein RLZZ296_447 [Pseudomonadota bacterium]|jgi:hypothetical protein
MLGAEPPARAPVLLACRLPLPPVMAQRQQMVFPSQTAPLASSTKRTVKRLRPTGR